MVAMEPSSSTPVVVVKLAQHVVQKSGALSLVRVYEQEEATTDLVTESNDPTSIIDDNANTTTSDDDGGIASWMDTTAAALHAQWPVNTTEYYRELILHHTTSASPNYPLSCSYLLLLHQPPQNNTNNSDDNNHDDKHPTTPRVIGHGRLTECFESAGGNAAAATYVLILNDFQRRGYGMHLMALLEQEAERLGYHYVYLWTQTAVDFYKRKLGYQTCHRVSLKRPCLKKLSATSVQSLESLLLKRREQVSSALPASSTRSTSQTQPKKRTETVTLLSDNSGDNGNNSKEDDVWLKKRLVEQVGSMLVSKEERLEEMRNTINATIQKKATEPKKTTSYNYVWNPNVPWQSQIGPSCGLVAVRMIRDYYYYYDNDETDDHKRESSSAGGSADDDNDDDDPVAAFPSLLQQAQEAGYTDDGEVFDAQHLTNLLQRQIDDYELQSKKKITISSGGAGLLLKAQLRNSDSVSITELASTLQNGGFWVIPYDCNPRTKQPAKLNGKHAHWGIVVGLLLCEEVDDDDDATTTATTTTTEDGSLSLVPRSSTDSFSLDETTMMQQNSNSCLLCVQHSLSKQWAIASTKEWMESNQQLVSLDSHKFSHAAESNHLNLCNKIIQIE